MQKNAYKNDMENVSRLVKGVKNTEKFKIDVKPFK